jgi:hypothetical protein
MKARSLRDTFGRQVRGMGQINLSTPLTYETLPGGKRQNDSWEIDRLHTRCPGPGISACNQ